MCKGVYFTQSEYFSEFEIRKRCAFQLQRPLRNCGGRTCLRNECLSPHPLPRAFSDFMTYQIAMENDETNIKVERISLLMRTELFMYFSY